MAIYVCENPPAPGNYGVLQVYKDRGRTIARIYNPLSGKRVKAAPEFANTRKHAAWLALAAPLASAAYCTLPQGRQRTHYQRLAGKAMRWLKEGKNISDVQLLLLEAVEVIRKELKQQRIQALLQQRKAGKKAVFTTPSVAVLQANGKIAAPATQKHVQQLRLHAYDSPDVGSGVIIPSAPPGAFSFFRSSNTDTPVPARPVFLQY